MTKPHPQWVKDEFACPVCGQGMHLTISNGMCCPWVPAHTGLIRTIDWRDRAVKAARKAFAAGRSKITRQYTAIKVARQYLKSNRKYF